MRYPVTPAVRFLRASGIEFIPHTFEYVERGGTAHSSEVLGVEEHRVIKSLLFETSEGEPLMFLQHGDLEVSEKRLARELGVRSIAPASADAAKKLTGYIFGGMSPFGLKTEVPIYAEPSVLMLDKIFINGGKRGFLVEIESSALQQLPVALIEASR